MENGAWRDRFAEAVGRSKKSMRQISLEAGRAAGYLYGIIKEGKDPTVDNLVAVLDVLDVSVSWIIAGVQVNPDEEELLRLYASLPDEARVALRQIAESIANRSQPASEPQSRVPPSEAASVSK
jgi:ribonucleoside-diphosphate reductase alpha chain